LTTVFHDADVARSAARPVRTSGDWRANSYFSNTSSKSFWWYSKLA